MRLSALTTYPVKGCRRVERERATVYPWGLDGDRRWMITDDQGRMLTQRQEPALTQIRPALVGGALLLRHDRAADLTVPAISGELGEVTIWRDTLPLSRAGEGADTWLSAVLDRKARLYYLDDPTRRPVNPRYGTAADRVSLADGYPLLLTNSASLDALNGWLAEAASQEGPLPMTRFRPNVVVDGAAAWAEDDWVGRRIRIGAVTFRAPKPCDRCVVTTTDQESGRRGHEPLRTLARRHKVDRSLLFGLNLIPDGDPGPDGGPSVAPVGRIAVGDEVTVLD